MPQPFGAQPERSLSGSEPARSRPERGRPRSTVAGSARLLADAEQAAVVPPRVRLASRRSSEPPASAARRKEGVRRRRRRRRRSFTLAGAVGAVPAWTRRCNVPER